MPTVDKSTITTITVTYSVKDIETIINKDLLERGICPIVWDKFGPLTKVSKDPFEGYESFSFNGYEIKYRDHIVV